MTELLPIDDHYHSALKALVGPFWGKPRISSLLGAYVLPTQALEDLAFEVMHARHVNTADLARLKVLGKIVGQPDFGFPLETYRGVVRGKIAANKSRGRPDDLINVIRVAAAVTAPTRIEHLSPATMLVELTQTLSAELIQALVYLLPKARGAGVQMHVFFSPTSAVAPYDYTSAGMIFSDLIDPITTPGRAWFDARVL